jgi:hypothetical protein
MQNLLQAYYLEATLIDAIAVGSLRQDLFFIGHFYGISINGVLGALCLFGIFLPSFYLLPY